MTTEQEQVEVSASKLQLLIANCQELKEKQAKEISKLKGQLKACEEKIDLYENTIEKLKTMKPSKTPRGEGTKKVIAEITKTREFDEWYEENKDKLIDEQYKRYYKYEVDELKERLNKLFN